MRCSSRSRPTAMRRPVMRESLSHVYVRNLPRPRNGATPMWCSDQSRNSAAGCTRRTVLRDQGGQAPAEYIMIVAFVAIPLYVAVQIAVRILAYYYRHLAFAVSLPFP